MNNSFENKIKSALENYEEDYNPSDWSDLEKKLNGGPLSGLIKTALISSAVIAAAGLVYYFQPEHKNEKIVSTEKNVVENISFPKPVISIAQEDFKGKNLSESSDASPLKKIIPENKKDNFSHSKTLPEVNPKLNSAPVLAVKSVDNSETSITEPPIKGQEKNEEIFSTPAPKASFHCEKNSVCSNSEVKFISENNDNALEYFWDFGDNQFSSQTNPVHIYKTAGIYSVKLQVSSKVDHRTDNQLLKDIITVNPTPTPDFSWRGLSDNQEIVFESNTEEISEMKWDFGDKQFSTDLKPSHTFNKKGSYPVSLSVKNNYGCTASIQKNITVVNDFNLFAPNAFSPNGDGKNDTWLPVGLLSGDYIFSLTILDKNGNIAFKSTSSNHPWDGRHAKSNDMVKTGDSFKWVAVVKDKNGVESSYGGVISIAESKD